ncbi:MAG TPA: CHAT domain-containing protein [Myxococcota bacterium]|nr:CHAT domain-containing protein [Myxococcota bacterium]
MELGGFAGVDHLLADGAALTAADVLSGPPPPARVVLSGCETGRTRPTDVETLGLAQAFVVAGAGAVVASVRPVDDAEAAVWMAALYGAGFASGDPATAFRAATLAVSWAWPGADVGAFRLIVP